MWRLGLLGLAGIALGLAAEWVGASRSEPGQWILDLAVGWTFIGCGLVAIWKRPESRTGWLLTATGFTWYLGNFAHVPGATLAWLAAHAVYLHRGPLMHLLLTFPSGRSRSQLTRGAVAAGYAAAVITPIWGNEGATIILAALLLAICIYDYGRSVGWLRRARRVALQAATGLSVVLAGTAAARMVLPAGDASGLSLVLYEVSLCLLAGSLLAGLLMAPWERVLVADLVVELGEARSNTLRGELSRALGDPSLEIGYWLPDRGIYVGSDGRTMIPPEPESNRAMTVLEHRGEPVAALIHDPAMLDDPGLLGAVSSAAELEAANAQLRADVQAQLEELAASRRRILEAGDEQRRRLERRLHDGAAARLRALAVILDRGERSATMQQTKGQIAHAEDQLWHTLEDLQRLANGLHPSVLVKHGLRTALAELAQGIQLPIDLDVMSARLPPRLAVAAYFICAEALTNAAKHSTASHVTVLIGSGNGWLTVEISDDGVGGADAGRGSGLRGLADRVETLGGKLQIESRPGRGTRLAAEIPLDDEAP